MSNKALEIPELELERNVRSSWLNLAYVQERSKMLDQMVVIYKDFADAAIKRYKAGESTLLEKTSAEGQYEKILMQQQQENANVLIYRQQLAQWLVTDSVYTLPENAFQKIYLSQVIESDTLNNPQLSYFRQMTEVKKQELKIEKSSFLPDLKVGYINQQIEGVSGLSGIQLGVGIPLFFWTQHGKVQAAKLGAEIAQKDYQSQLLSISNLFQTKQQEVNKYRMEVNWYDTQGLTTANELIRYAKNSYSAGEIDYVEFINATTQAIGIRSDYLDALNQYNQAITTLQYVSGSFNR